MIGRITLTVCRGSYLTLCAHIPTTQRGRFNIYFVPICTWEFILIYGTASSASDSFILCCHLDDSVFAIRYFGTSLPALQNTLCERRFFHQSGYGDTTCRYRSHLRGELHHGATEECKGDKPQHSSDTRRRVSRLAPPKPEYTTPAWSVRGHLPPPRQDCFTVILRSVPECQLHIASTEPPLLKIRDWSPPKKFNHCL